jgi:UDP-glucose 4-epimerase
MHIGVTGAAGLLGSAITRAAVAAGHTVVAIDKTPPTTPDPAAVAVRTIDMRDYAAFEAAVVGADALIHTAALATPFAASDPEVHDTNVVIGYHALRAAEQAGIARVCLASSVNAIGGRFSRMPRYDYFPLDESHPSYAEDPYSLSKWICEQQAAAFGRRVPSMSIACLRLHALRDRRDSIPLRSDGRSWTALWGYTPTALAVQACLAAIAADFGGAEVIYVTAPDTFRDEPSVELRDRYFPDVPIVGDLSGNRSFFDTAKADRLLGNFRSPALPAQ